jgi:hypothetical protein
MFSALLLAGFTSRSWCFFALLAPSRQLPPVPRLFMGFQHSHDPPARSLLFACSRQFPPHLFTSFQHSRDPPATPYYSLAVCSLPPVPASFIYMFSTFVWPFSSPLLFACSSLAPVSSHLVCFTYFQHSRDPATPYYLLAPASFHLVCLQIFKLMWASCHFMLPTCTIRSCLICLQVSILTWPSPPHWFRLIRALPPVLVLGSASFDLFLTFMWPYCHSSPLIRTYGRCWLHSFSYRLLVARKSLKLNCIMKTTMYIYACTVSIDYQHECDRAVSGYQQWSPDLSLQSSSLLLHIQTPFTGSHHSS